MVLRTNETLTGFEAWRLMQTSCVWYSLWLIGTSSTTYEKDDVTFPSSSAHPTNPGGTVPLENQSFHLSGLSLPSYGQPLSQRRAVELTLTWLRLSRHAWLSYRWPPEYLRGGFCRVAFQYHVSSPLGSLFTNIFSWYSELAGSLVWKSCKRELEFTSQLSLLSHWFYKFAILVDGYTSSK